MSSIELTKAVSSTILAQHSRPARATADPAHLIALRDSVYRAPGDVRILRVLAGCAWVSLGSIDHILMVGDELAIPPGAGWAVVSALGGKTLILEAETGRVR